MLRKVLVIGLATLTLSIVSFGFGSRSASAEVLMNDWVPIVGTFDNPCEDGFEPIAVRGRVHHVWYTTPEGGLKMNIQGHLTGVDSDGTEYVINLQRHMEHFAYFDPLGNLYPFSDVFARNVVSKGSSVNAQIVITFTLSNSLNPAGNPNAVTVTACRG